jgi:hypothetical protein
MLNTVPADYFVSVNPEVLAAGGTGLELIGLVLTNGTKVPIGTIQSFPSLISVGAYFGTSSQEYNSAAVYFGGFINSEQVPGAILFAQCPTVSVPAYLRGGSLASMTLAQLQALSGTISLTIDGTVKTSGSINLSAATSFSNAATLIQAGFASLYDAVTASTSSIAAGTATNCTTGTITNNILTVAGSVTGGFVVGGLLTGTGVTAGTTILNQLTGAAGLAGTYTVSAIQNVASTTITQTYGLLTVVTMASGAFAVGQVISGGTTAAGTTITAFGTGTGQAGTYITSGGAQTVSASAISGGPLAVTFDSVASAFVITGGTPGTAGVITVASGTLSAGINLTTVTGATTSQGSQSVNAAVPLFGPAVVTPATLMNGIIAQTTNWATFMTTFNPDVSGNANKLAFAQWNNTQNGGYMYACWDTDITPTTSFPATSCLGYLLSQANISGTCLLYDPTNEGLAAYACGLVAAINFNSTNGNLNPAYTGQVGLAATVTNATVLSNLQQNGYNCMVASSTAAQQFTFFWNGQISGPWLWMQPYINQIWLNAQFQLDLMELLINAKSIPYNNAGMTMIHNALGSTITAALNFGAIQPGINLSSLQITEVNNAAGGPIDQVLSTRGWYLQILQPSAAVRQARGTPICNFWYMDGGSVNMITLNSVDLL